VAFNEAVDAAFAAYPEDEKPAIFNGLFKGKKGKNVGGKIEGDSEGQQRRMIPLDVKYDPYEPSPRGLLKIFGRDVGTILDSLSDKYKLGPVGTVWSRCSGGLAGRHIHCIAYTQTTLLSSSCTGGEGSGDLQHGANGSTQAAGSSGAHR
jgi:hypothetical protein